MVPVIKTDSYTLPEGLEQLDVGSLTSSHRGFSTDHGNGFHLEIKISVKELISSLSEPHQVRGSLSRFICDAHAIDRANDLSLTFCRANGQKGLEMIRNSQSRVIICSNSLKLTEADYRDKTLIQVANPRLTYSRLLLRYIWHPVQADIHSSAIIDNQARLGRGIHIGPQCYIGNCEIGDNTIIEGHVHIYPDVKIGKRVVIHPGAIIGTEGISFERNEKQELEWFPQLGGVIIEDDVEIGANSVITRGPLPRSNTIIGQGTKLDTLVEIGHGVRVGRHCIIIGQSIICGRVTIGDYSYISCKVCVKQGLKIGSRVLLGMGSTILEDVPDDLVMVGTPARPLRKNIL